MIVSHMHVKAPGYPRHVKDDELVNDFMSGYAVADMLASALGERDFRDISFIAEDWGWLIVAKPNTSDFEFSVALSSLAEPTDDKEAMVELMIAIQPQKLTKGVLWWKKDISKEIELFSRAVFGSLNSDDGIEVIEEFSEIA